MKLVAFTDLSKWDRMAYDLACVAQRQSKDPSTQVGAAVIGETPRDMVVGFNGYPASIPDVRLDDRAYKLPRTIHAEINALWTAKGKFRPVTLASTHFPCHQCAPFIAMAAADGLRRVVVPVPDGSYAARYADSIRLSQEIMEDAKIEIFQFDWRSYRI